MGKTKIIATVGPSTNSKQKLKELILKGCDAIRINMRQCDYTFCDLVFQMVDELNKELNTCVSIILDTNGPDLRIGLINEDKTKKMFLEMKQSFLLIMKILSMM